MSRFGNTQIHDRVQSNVGDPATEGPLKTPAARRGLADLRNANATRTVEKNKLLLSANAFTPKNRSKLAPSGSKQSSRKLNLFVFEDATSPEKETVNREPDEDEELDTCPTLSNGDHSIFFKSMRSDATILTDEQFDAEEDEEDEEKENDEEENDEGGVERYFKLVYNVAEKAEEMWKEMEVEVHDSDTEIETCGRRPRTSDEWHEMWEDSIEGSESSVLAESDRMADLERRLYEEEWR
ncbi:hypothetical protein PMAYCL1PPCAC_03005, partial [Pristionchus mayeri]